MESVSVYVTFVIKLIDGAETSGVNVQVFGVNHVLSLYILQPEYVGYCFRYSFIIEPGMVSRPA